MWWWIIGFVVVCAVISVVIARRGPGDGESHDPTRTDPAGWGSYPGGSFGGDGGGGG